MIYATQDTIATTDRQEFPTQQEFNDWLRTQGYHQGVYGTPTLAVYVNPYTNAVVIARHNQN